jgi:hypothetical protein
MLSFTRWYNSGTFPYHAESLDIDSETVMVGTTRRSPSSDLLPLRLSRARVMTGDSLCGAFAEGGGGGDDATLGGACWAAPRFSRANSIKDLRGSFSFERPIDKREAGLGGGELVGCPTVFVADTVKAWMWLMGRAGDSTLSWSRFLLPDKSILDGVEELASCDLMALFLLGGVGERRLGLVFATGCGEDLPTIRSSRDRAFRASLSFRGDAAAP